MENFTNETIDTKHLPRFEEVTFSKLDPAYWTVIWVELLIVALIIIVAAIAGVFFDEKLAAKSTIIYSGLPVLFL